MKGVAPEIAKEIFGVNCLQGDDEHSVPNFYTSLLIEALLRIVWEAGEK